jgi:IS1 family transposase
MPQNKSKIDFIARKNKTKISKRYKTKRIERSNNLVTKVINKLANNSKHEIQN